MKKTILMIASACAFIFGSAVLTSCDSASTTSNEETTEEHVHAEGEGHGDMDMTTTEEEVVLEVSTEGETAEDAKFACAMKCEGDKTYAEVGQCPKCGMDLAEMKTEETTTEETEGETETQEN